MAASTSLPPVVKEPSVRYEGEVGTVELKGVFLWVGVALVLGVLL